MPIWEKKRVNILSLENIDVFYGKAQALHGISMTVGRGEIVSLIGRNGAGKTTTLKSIIGLLPCSRGKRMVNGNNVTKEKPHVLSRLGISYVPETREIFPNLSVLENLRMAEVAHNAGYWTLDRIFELFPLLQERSRSRGDTLSGGEQQMLAIGRGVLSNPRLIMLDEPTEGLAPFLVKAVKEAIVAINEENVSVLLVEQKLKIPLSIAHRHYIIENGVIVWKGDGSDLLSDKEDVEKYISL
jgi:branched-chain amino acid transport system ATP-binding protein